MRSALRVLQALFLVAAVLAPAAAPRPAHAHETRDVGDYQFVVGWSGEPAFEGLKNGISLRISHKDSGEPVAEAEKTLQAEVVFGGQQRTVQLRGVFRTPGSYTADILPTREGDYRFRFFGTIENNRVDETFDSAEGKFNSVESLEVIKFPEAVPAAAVQDQAPVAATGPPVAATDGGAAETLATVGAATGTIALLVAVLALITAGRRTRESQSTPPAAPREGVRA